VTANQGYWVGEHGPEWFTPSTTGMITNHAASRTMYGSDAMTTPAAPVVNVSSPSISATHLPDRVTLVDESGALLGRMRVVAEGAVDDRALAQSRGVA